jgi:GDP-L-fucose synthase
LLKTTKANALRILITGATGSLGKNLVIPKSVTPILLSSKDANLVNREQVREIFEKYKPESVIHLAAMCGGRQLSIEKPSDLLTVNTLMAINIAEIAREFGIKRVGFALSGAAYTSNFNHMRKEEDLHDGPLVAEDYAYGYSKRFTEVLVRSFNSQFDLDFYCFVVNGVIGNNMNYEEAKSIVIASLIKRVFLNLKTSNPIEVWGDGSPLRQYTWAGDLSKNIFWCHDNQKKSTTLNIGTNEVVSIRDCAETVCKYFNVPKNRLFFNESKGNGKMSQLTDNSEFVRESGFKFRDFDSSIREVIANFILVNK